MQKVPSLLDVGLAQPLAWIRTSLRLMGTQVVNSHFV